MTNRCSIVAMAILLGSVVAAANDCVAPEPPKISGALCGRLIDATGAAVPNVGLRVLGDSNKVVADGKADSKGDFVFPDLANGRYRLTPTSGGWLIEFGEFDIKGARRTCVHPVTVRLDLTCCCFGSGISKRRPSHY